MERAGLQHYVREHRAHDAVRPLTDPGLLSRRQHPAHVCSCARHRAAHLDGLRDAVRGDAPLRRRLRLREPRARAGVGDDVQLEPDGLVDPLRRGPLGVLRLLRAHPAAALVGRADQQPGADHVGRPAVTPTGAFLTGTALIVILVVIFATGMNFYFRIQNVLFVVAMLGVLLTIAVLLPKNPASFLAGFNHSLASTAGTPNPYQAVMSAAKKDGFVTAPFSLYWTIIPITWIYLELVFNQSSAYIGGEVRRPGRVQIWSMPAAAVISTAGAVLLVWVLQRTAGTTFLGALAYDNGAALHFSTAPTY